MKRNPTTTTRRITSKREQLNALMEAVALVLARRQMKRHWGAGHRATLTSVI